MAKIQARIKLGNLYQRVKYLQQASYLSEKATVIEESQQSERRH